MKMNNIQIQKQLHSVLIQNDETLLIFHYLQAKLQRFRNNSVLLRIAKAKHSFARRSSFKKFRFIAFAIL